MQALRGSPARPNTFFGRFRPNPISVQRSRTPRASKDGGPASDAPQAADDMLPAAVWRELRVAASPLHTPASASVQSWALAVACFLAAAASIATFNLLAGQIAAAAAAGGFQGDAATLELLDVRGGYSPADVAATMAAWGPRGRALYLLVEAVDVVVYFTAYRGLMLVLTNRLSAAVARQWPALGWTRRSAMLPYILAGKQGAVPMVAAACMERASSPGMMCLAAMISCPLYSNPSCSQCYAPSACAGIDLLEDALQVSATLAYSAGPSAAGASTAWSALVGAASTVNQLKWALVPPIGASLVLLGGGALAAAWQQPNAGDKDM
ncbi:hypothetical protein ABPG75_007709 [Micractinium tetrahymenae]